MQWVREHKPDPQKKKAYHMALTITLVGNVLLAVAKGLVSYYSGSIALYADTANSISDVIYSLAMVGGLSIALKPPDLSHPQGHSRFEPLVGLLVAVMMGIAGYEALRSSIERFFSGGSVIGLDLPTTVLLASALVKAGMYSVITRLARRVQSPSLRATAKDHLSDVLTSVAAFIGILGSNFIHPLMDPIAGVLVALWIFKSAFEAGKENFAFLTGAGASDELREKIIELVKNVEGVDAVHHMMSDYVGPKLVVDIHINLPGDKTLDEVHTISDRVIESLETLDDVDRAYVHVEPFTDMAESVIVGQSKKTS
ncbi:MAG: cation diffusion facilitator family transporter [Chloroflexota bacterium]|nr:cation diffusion facilitator family transporter [Chloroflexota bacterium]